MITGLTHSELMAYDLTTIPLNTESYAAVTDILDCFDAAGADLNAPKLLEREAHYGITFAQAADALSAHRVYENERRTSTE